MQSFIILHTNDIHGRIEGVARIATMVEQIRTANPDAPVLYFDAGDSEETTSRLSNLTKGVAMHRLLTLAGCDAVAVGNGGLLRYGHQVLPEYAEVARYPQLLANLRLPDGNLLPGIQPTVLLNVGTLRLGLIGVTDDFAAQGESFYETYFGLRALPVLPLLREMAAGLRQNGADTVIVLSHMGLPNDRKLAEGLQNDIPLIIGAHTHNLLPEGERMGTVFIAQAGEFAQYLGRLDLNWDGEQLTVQRATVLPVAEHIQPTTRIQAEVDAIEAEVERFLDVIIGDLAEPLDFAADRECGVADFMADVLRERMQAEVAIVAAGQAFSGPLSAGPLQRVTLWDVCSSSANPGVVTMTGAQLQQVVSHGLDPVFAADTTPGPMRGKARGLLHLSGACTHGGQLLIDNQPVEAEREYRVAGTDWELDTYGGYAEAQWELQPTYDMPIILREAVEDYLAIHKGVRITKGRLEDVRV